MATELADFDEQLDEIISEHKVKKSKEKRLLRKKELKTSRNIDKINSLNERKLIKNSNKTFSDQILKLFHEDYFADLIIECDNLFKYLHSCIFIARVPVLFELLKERFIVGNDNSLVPVFSCPTAHSNPLYDNSNCLNTQLDDSQLLDERQLQQEERIEPYYLHIRLPSELNRVFNLIAFLQNVYSSEDIESEEHELIFILNKIKLFEDNQNHKLNTQDNLIIQNKNRIEQQMNERFNKVTTTTTTNELDDDDCEKMKVDEVEEPMYINLDENIVRKTKSTSSSSDQDHHHHHHHQNEDSAQNDSLKKGKTFLLSKVNIENEQFEINLLNEDNDDEIVNKFANIDNEIKEMKSQIDTVVEMDKFLCVDPENEEQQLITALSNEKIEINNACLLKNDDNGDDEIVYGNIINRKDNTDTVSDVSEICDELSIENNCENNDLVANQQSQDNKYSDSLIEVNNIELSFDNKEVEIKEDRNSLFYELMNIENKVQQVVNKADCEFNYENKKATMLIDNHEIYSSYENDLEEDKTLSASMVRSGTFNLPATIDKKNNLNNNLEKYKLSESEDDSSSFSRKIEQDSLMSNSNVKCKTKTSKQQQINNKSTSLTKQQQQQHKQPIDLHQHEKFSKKSLQYFFDETQIIAKQQEIDEMERSFTNANKQSSGLFFIGLEDSQNLNSIMSKSSTFDRKKSKQKTLSEDSSSLNSSFIDEKKLNNQQQQHQKTTTTTTTAVAEELLPMSIITRKDHHINNNNDGMFRLGNHYKTLSGIQQIKLNQRQTQSATLRTTMMSRKTKSEISSSSYNSVEKNDENDEEMISRKNTFSFTRLGEDLLKLFINQINCDFSLLVSDKSQKLGAHKCILMARSEFFAKKLTNNLDCNQTNLSDFSYDSVHFVLCHIYSGVIDIPNFRKNEENDASKYHNFMNYDEQLNLAELLSLSDLFQLTILKDVILFELKKTFCHHFHKPCAECIAGVIFCLHLAQKCEIASLYNCCIDWICRNYQKIWPTKQFATLFTQMSTIQNSTSPKHHHHKSKQPQPIHKNNEIINSIYTNLLDSITNDNIIERILNLQQLASSMTKLKWNEMIIKLIEELIEDCCKYLAANYDQIISSQTFIQLGLEKTWQLEILEIYLIMAVDLMKCETAIRVFMHLENIVIMCEAVNDNGKHSIYANTTKNQFSDEFIRTVQKLYKTIERYLIHNAAEAVYCESWNELNPSIQQYIKNSAVLVFEFEKPLAKRPILTSSLMKSSSRQSSADKTTNSAKRRSSEKTTRKSTTEDEQQPCSRQSTLTRNSAQKSKENREKKDANNYEDMHIYDEVPSDLINEIKEKKECLVEYAKANKKKSQQQNTQQQHQQQQQQQQQQPQIAKVSPYIPSSELNILSSNNYENYDELDVENNYENIIYDESINLQKVGSESSLASSCLQEAETLEENLHELNRKLQNQRINALRQCKQQINVHNKKSPNSINQLSNNAQHNNSNGSPVLRTSIRSFNRQQSANSIISNHNSVINSASSTNRTTKASSRSANSNKKPPFK